MPGSPSSPTVWLLVCTLTAGFQKIFHENVKIGFLAHAEKFQAAIDKGQVLAPAKSMAQMQQIVFNDKLDAALASFFVLVVIAMVIFGLRACVKALRENRPTAVETPFERMPRSAPA